MADKKITELNALAAVDVDSSTDVLAIVDTSANETKKVTVANLVAGKDALAEMGDTDISGEAAGQLLIYDGTNSWDNKTLTGDVTINSSGVTAIQADSVALGTDTAGNYVGTVVGGAGIDSTGATSGEGIAHTLTIDSTVATLAGSQTLTNKTLNNPGINETVAVTASSTELNHCESVTSPIQAQLNLKAALASPSLSGTPLAPTADPGSSSTQIATCAFVTTAVQGEDTLAELNDTNITSAADASLLLYDSGTWIDVALSGDATISDTGVLTVATLNQDTTGNAATATLAATVTTNAHLTGDVTSVGNATSIAAGVIVDADVKSDAAIAYSKLGTIPTWNQDTTGTAATVTGAAQAAITSVGTLSGLTVNGVVDLASSELTIAGSGGTVDHVLTTDGSGNITWAAADDGHSIKEESGSALTTRTNMTFIGELVEAVDNAVDDSTDILINAKTAWLYG